MSHRGSWRNELPESNQSSLPFLWPHHLLHQIWMRNDWKTNTGETVLNKRLFLTLWLACRRMEAVDWKHIRGHAGVDGNEGAHHLALQAARAAKKLAAEDESICEDYDDDGYNGGETLDEEMIERILEADERRH